MLKGKGVVPGEDGLIFADPEKINVNPLGIKKGCKGVTCFPFESQS
jgi:hypothetical protein